MMVDHIMLINCNVNVLNHLFKLELGFHDILRILNKEISPYL